LRKSPIYKQYIALAWAAPTVATVQAHIDAITEISVETLPLIKFLNMVLQAKQKENINTQFDLVEDYTKLGLNRIPRVLYGYYLSGATSIHDIDTMTLPYDIGITTHTLAGGALANSTIHTNSTAGNKSTLLWLMWSWDTAPAAAYTFDFHENAGANERNLSLAPNDNGNKKCWLYWDAPSADTNLEVSIAGGAGAEVLTAISMVGEFP